MSTSFGGEEADEFCCCEGEYVLGRCGCICAWTEDDEIQILKINTTNDSHCFVRNSIDADYDYGWDNAIMGIDGCIYWAPWNARCIFGWNNAFTAFVALRVPSFIICWV